MKLKAALFGLVLGIGTTTVLCATQGAREVPEEIQKNLHDWQLIANSLRILQMFLGVLGTVAALFVTSFTSEIGVRWIKVCSFVAAISIAILSAFDVGAKADSTRRGWRHLTAAILRFKTDPNFTEQQLIDAYSEGEAMVGDVPFRQQRPPVSTSSPPP